MTDPRLKVQDLINEMIANRDYLKGEHSEIIDYIIQGMKSDWFEQKPEDLEKVTKIQKNLESTIKDGDVAIDKLMRQYTKLLRKHYTIKKTEGVKSGSYPTKQTKKVIEGLKPYWDDKLPEDENRKTWFYELATDTGLSFSAIEKIEQKYRPTSFIPKSYF